MTGLVSDEFSDLISSFFTGSGSLKISKKFFFLKHRQLHHDFRLGSAIYEWLNKLLANHLLSIEPVRQYDNTLINVLDTFFFENEDLIKDSVMTLYFEFCISYPRRSILYRVSQPTRSHLFWYGRIFYLEFLVINNSRFSYCMNKYH